MNALNPDVFQAYIQNINFLYLVTLRKHFKQLFSNEVRHDNSLRNKCVKLFDLDWCVVIFDHFYESKSFHAKWNFFFFWPPAVIITSY